MVVGVFESESKLLKGRAAALRALPTPEYLEQQCKEQDVEPEVVEVTEGLWMARGFDLASENALMLAILCSQPPQLGSEQHRGLHRKRGLGQISDSRCRLRSRDRRVGQEPDHEPGQHLGPRASQPGQSGRIKTARLGDVKPAEIASRWIQKSTA